MNLTGTGVERESPGLLQTTSELILGTARKCLILAATALPIQGTSSAVSADNAFETKDFVHDQTNSGFKVAPDVSTGSAVMEIRRLSGLTWEQLSALMGVARRSLHFWAS